MSAGEKDYSEGICRRGFADNSWRGEPLITRERVSMFAPLHRLTHLSYSNFYKERSISRSVRSSRIVDRTSLDKIRVASRLYIYELEKEVLIQSVESTLILRNRLKMFVFFLDEIGQDKKIRK